MLTCFLCRDEFDKLNKICICQDSMICDDCFSMKGTRIMDKCPICKRELNFYYKKNYSKYICALSLSIIYYLTIYSLQLLFPILIFINNDEIGTYYNNSIFVFWISLFFIIFVDRINYYFLSIIYFKENIRNNNNENTLRQLSIFLDLLKTSMIIVIYVFISDIYNNNQLSFLYFLLIILTFYIVPFIIYSMILISENIFNNLIELKKKSYDKKIKIVGFVYAENRSINEIHV